MVRSHPFTAYGYAWTDITLLCSGICHTMGQLIAARAVQGIGGAGMVCLVSILITGMPMLHPCAFSKSIHAKHGLQTSRP